MCYPQLMEVVELTRGTPDDPYAWTERTRFRQCPEPHYISRLRMDFSARDERDERQYRGESLTTLDVLYERALRWHALNIDEGGLDDGR